MANDTFLVFSTLFGVSEHEYAPDAKKYTPGTFAYYRATRQWYIVDAVPIYKGHKLSVGWVLIQLSKVPKEHQLMELIHS